MEQASKNPNYIQTGDSFKMLDRLIEQYEKYGSFDWMTASNRADGYFWSEIRNNFYEHVAKGDERYRKYFDFAKKEVEKLNAEGRGFFMEKSSKFNVDFYVDKYVVLHPMGRELHPRDRLEILNIEIHRTEDEIKTGRRKVDVTSKLARDMLSEKTEDNPLMKSVQKDYIASLKLKGTDKSDY